MVEVSNELIYEVLKSMPARMETMDRKLDELKSEQHATRSHLLAVQQDIHNIYAILERHEKRLERIERRLELTDTVQ